MVYLFGQGEPIIFQTEVFWEFFQSILKKFIDPEETVLRFWGST